MQLLNREEFIGKWDKPAFRWTFEVVAEDHKGDQVTRVTGTDLKPGESLGQLMSELFGEELTVGSEVDLDDPIGQLYDVLLIPGNGKNVVFKKATPIDA